MRRAYIAVGGRVDLAVVGERHREGTLPLGWALGGGEALDR